MSLLRTKDPLRSENILFQDHLAFQPDFSPATMLRLGIHCGWYFRGNIELIADLPPGWFDKARWSEHPDCTLNYTGVRAHRSFGEDAELEENEHDPLGWFQWYCRFTAGRRLGNYDKLQIARWASARHRLHNKLGSASHPNDMLSRRQELLEWACHPRPISEE